MFTKKRFIQLLLLLVFLFLFSCKKGEEDPFITLRSREARLINTWLLQSSSTVTEEKYSDGTIITITEDYDGEKCVITKITPYETTTVNSYYTLEYEFKKHFNYTKKYIETDPLDSGYKNEINEDGIWEFLSKSKTRDIKNKEQITLMPSWQYNEFQVIDSDFPYEIWTLIKLSNDEIKVKTETENSNSISDYTYSRKSEYIFKSK